jgi:hypothetical protein
MVHRCDGADWGQAAYKSRENEEGSGMAANTRVDIARSDIVGSLLRPAYLREAR